MNHQPVILLPIMVLVGGLILRVACWISGAAVPPWLYATFAALLTRMVEVLVTLFAGLAIVFFTVDWGLTEPQLRLAATLLGFPVQLLFVAAMYRRLLEVSYGKAIIIRLAEVPMALTVGVIVAVLLLLIREGPAGFGI